MMRQHFKVMWEFGLVDEVYDVVHPNGTVGSAIHIVGNLRCYFGLGWFVQRGVDSEE